jgi:hypothetical protein
MLRSITSGATEHRLRRFLGVFCSSRKRLIGVFCSSRKRLIGVFCSSRKRLIAAAVALALIVEFVTAAAILSRPATTPATAVGTHTMRLVDRGAPVGLSARITSEIPGAVDAVTSFWGDDWPREVVIVTTGTDADFAALTGQPARDWTGVAAVAVADRVDPEKHQAFGQRIVFAPGANAMSTTALRIVLRHELFHYAARADTAFDAPRWLVEGVADYVGRPATRPPAAVESRLPSDAELDAGGAEESAAYDRAWWFARFVADQYGPSALRRLYVEACGPGHRDPSTAVRAVLSVDMNDLLTRWKRWLAG